MECEVQSNAIVSTICQICNSRCAINLTVDDGVIVKVEGRKDHPITRGYICPKGRSIPELLYSPKRLKHPLKKIAEGKWEEITWDEAIDMIAQKLKEIKQQNGAEALAVHVGRAGVRKEFTQYVKYFCSLYGTPNFMTSGSHCHLSKRMSNVYTYGALPVPDYANSDCIVLWGSNPQESCPSLTMDINQAVKQGAKLIVIDPYTTQMAKKSDYHLRLRPGTDGALALGMLYVIITEHIYDREFVEKYTLGFDRLEEHIKAYSPDFVEKITWVPAEQIINAARLYAASPTACITTGNALELLSNGFQAQRAICILQTITGNLDISGGIKFIPPPPLAPLPVNDWIPSRKPAIGEIEFPLFFKFVDNAQANILSDAILAKQPYEIKALIVAGSNPIATWPNAGKLIKALKTLDFVVVMDNFMTETAQLADVVLPASTFLGGNEFFDAGPTYGQPIIELIPGIVDDEGCLTNWEFWKELAWKMGYKEYYPWENSEAAIDFRLQPLNLSYKDLKNKPDGHAFSSWKPQKYKSTGFKTPSGKVEIYSEELRQYGYDPLPTYIEPTESYESTPDLAVTYPFILTTGARLIPYLHSQFHNLPSLRKLSPDPLVVVNTKKAEKLGITKGETVVIESLRGSIEMTVKLNDYIDPRVIFIPHGWEQANANMLTANYDLDPVTGFPPDRCLLARIVKKSGSSRTKDQN